MRPRLLLLLVLLGLGAGARAQRADLRFRPLGLAEGLPQTFVSAVAQDSLGFIWLGTSGGLARTDGVRMDVFEPDPDDPASLPGPVVEALAVTPDGALWVGFERAGLAWFDPVRQGFERVPLRPEGGGPLAPAQVTALLAAPDGVLWVGTPDGLVRLDPATGRTRAVRDGPDFVVTALAPASDGGLWVGVAGRRLYHLDRDGGLGRPLRTGNWIYDVVDLGPTVWVGTTSGLLAYRPATGEARRVEAAPLRRTVRAFYAEPGGPLWVSTDEGLVFADPSTGAVLGEWPNAPGNAAGLPGAPGVDLLRDRQGSLWLASGGSGAAVVDLETPLIRVIRGGEGPTALEPPSPRAIESDASSFWVGLNGGGLARIDRATGVVSRLPFPTVPAGLRWSDPADRTVYGLGWDRAGALWSVVRWGAVRHGPDGGLERAYPFPSPDVMAVDPAFVYEDRSGRLWVGAGRVLALDREAGTYTRVLDQAGAVAVHEAADGVMWFATFEGLVRYDPRTGAREVVGHDPDDAGSLTSDRVVSMAAQGDSVLWVGTVAGLNRLDVRTRRARRVTAARSGLPNNFVNGVLVGNDGRVWVSTNRGLARIDPATLSVTAVGPGRGLQGPEYNRGASHAAADGTLLFGGIQGLNVFNPAALRENRHPPEVRLRRVTAGDEVALAGPGAAGPDGRLRLRPGQDVLSFEYVGLHYAAPEAVRYQFRLDGADVDWQPVTALREARYTNLAPGTYTFRVRAASGYGVWSEPTALLTVALPPPWWASTPFRALLVVVGVGATVWAVRRRTGAARERERRLRVEVEARTEALAREQERTARQADELGRLNAQQSRLFANVSHETRTPLTLILGPVEDALARDDLPPDLQRSLGGVRRNGLRLLRLVDQILDLARLEAGHTELDLRPVDLGAVVATLAAAFEEYAGRRGLTLSHSVPAEPVVGLFDVALLEHVLFNLLSNAIKFTPEGGKVDVSLGEKGGAAVLVVRDTGRGIPPDRLETVFDRFEQAQKGQDSSTGLGLALVKEAAERLGGSVRVTSRVGFGTRFTVRLPLRDAGDVPVDAYAPGLEAPEAAAPAAPDEADGPRPVALVVEDAADVRAYVADVLRPAYRVVEAADGAAGLEAARAAAPDLVVSDVAMPGLDGLGLVASLRADPALRRVPVILLTARAEVEDRVAGLEAGADAYLAKPFDSRELRAQADALVEARRAWRAGLAAAPLVDAFPDALSADDALRRDVEAAIHDGFADPAFGVEALAAAVGLSASQLRRRLRELEGASPSEAIRRYRLRQAAGLLARQTGTVAEAAFAVGFNSVSHFSRSFRAEFGRTPSEFAAEAAGGPGGDGAAGDAQAP